MEMWHSVISTFLGIHDYQVTAEIFSANTSGTVRRSVDKNNDNIMRQENIENVTYVP